MSLPPTSCGQDLQGVFLSHIRGAVDSHIFAAWFRDLDLGDFKGGEVVASVHSSFVKNYMERRFLPVMQEAARACLGANAGVRLAVRSQESPEAGPRIARERPLRDDSPSCDSPSCDNTSGKTNGNSSKNSSKNHLNDKHRNDSRLNDGYLFENFVVGPSNQFSHAACLQVIGAPARSFNPLFIHGASGLGKSHLLQATCRTMIHRNPSFRVLYVNCEEFISRFVAALSGGTLDAFRRRLRRVDCLVVDDIHFLSKKRGMQEEFFHTFNALYDNKKQIVLSADSKPHDMAHFEERLLTRFQWGLLTSIDPPSLETRQTIAVRKAQDHNRHLPESVSGYIARIVRRNVRELEGAVNKVLAAADFLNREIDLALAKEALSDLSAHSDCQKRPLSPSDVATTVSSHFGVRVSDLKSSRRLRSLVIPRQISMYLIKSLSRCSLKDIGVFFGGRDHTTVLYALQRIETLMSHDAEIRKSVQALFAELQEEMLGGQ